MAAKGKGKSHEQIIAGFQELRQQQRNIAGKISELNVDLKEHELVYATFMTLYSKNDILTTHVQQLGTLQNSLDNNWVDTEAPFVSFYCLSGYILF